jgi:Uma2 family endonuclease
VSAPPHAPVLTIEEFDRLDSPEGGELELVDGEVFEAAYPAYGHNLIQDRIVKLLEGLRPNGHVSKELGYEIRNTPRPTKRRADVDFLTTERHRIAKESDRVSGALDFIAEVLPPSNVASTINRLEELCLQYGCMEFWVVDAENGTVRVRHAGENTVTIHRIGDTIRLHAIPSEIRVADVFAISSDQ